MSATKADKILCVLLYFSAVGKEQVQKGAGIAVLTIGLIKQTNAHVFFLRHNNLIYVFVPIFWKHSLRIL